MVDTALAYLDESGDLGWKFDNEYQDGGSSRYFAIGIAVGINRGNLRFGKVVEALHKQQGWTSKKEKKWATIGPQGRKVFCQLAAKELSGNEKCKVFVAVCRKENMPEYLRAVDVRTMYPDAPDNEIVAHEAKYKGRAHLVYSMMVAETLAAHLPALDKFSYCPDELNGGQKVLENILTYRLLIQDGRETELNRVEYQAPMQGGLDFADMIAGAVWEAYERGDASYLDIIGQHIQIKEFNQLPLNPNLPLQTLPALAQEQKAA
jgi:hypothetical protein